jgi:hypothetical protein
MLDETRENEKRLEAGSAEWRRWWEEHGERELRCILMAAWDPVGAGDAPEAWDEYDSYIAGAAHRLRDAPDADEAERSVAAYLDHIERDYMDGGADRAARRNDVLASKLVAWHEWSFRRRGRPPQEWIGDD